MNGEKFVPLAAEGLIRQHPLVKEAVLFGNDRAVPGLLLFRVPGTSHLTDEQFIDSVWPAVVDSNSQVEGYSQISRDMIAVLPEHIDCPSTEKNSIKRAQIYRDFATVIDGAYKEPTSNGTHESLKLTVPELEDWILNTCHELGCEVPDKDANFFAAGIDSLKAIHLRSMIQKHIDLGGRQSQCTSMVVFDSGNARNLAQTLFNIRTGMGCNGKEGPNSNIEEMQEMIDRYSNFDDSRPLVLPTPKRRVVVSDPTNSSSYTIRLTIFADSYRRDWLSGSPHPLCSRVLQQCSQSLLLRQDRPPGYPICRPPPSSILEGERL